MARAFTQEELRWLTKRGLLEGINEDSILGGAYPDMGYYPGGPEIPPVLETAIGGLLDQPPTKVYEEDPKLVPPPKRRDMQGGISWAISPGAQARFKPWFQDIKMRPDDPEFGVTLLHELRHGGLQYLKDNPHLIPAIRYYASEDEGEIGRSLRDILKSSEAVHKAIFAVSPSWEERSVEGWEEGPEGPQLAFSGFKDPETRAAYVEAMRQFNKALAGERTRQEQPSATKAMKKRLKKKKRKK